MLFTAELPKLEVNYLNASFPQPGGAFFSDSTVDQSTTIGPNFGKWNTFFMGTLPPALSGIIVCKLQFTTANNTGSHGLNVAIHARAHQPDFPNVFSDFGIITINATETEQTFYLWSEANSFAPADLPGAGIDLTLLFRKLTGGQPTPSDNQFIAAYRDNGPRGTVVITNIKFSCEVLPSPVPIFMRPGVPVSVYMTTGATPYPYTEIINSGSVDLTENWQPVCIATTQMNAPLFSSSILTHLEGHINSCIDGTSNYSTGIQFEQRLRLSNSLVLNTSRHTIGQWAPENHESPVFTTLPVGNYNPILEARLVDKNKPVRLKNCVLALLGRPVITTKPTRG